MVIKCTKHASQLLAFACNVTAASYCQPTYDLTAQRARRKYSTAQSSMAQHGTAWRSTACHSKSQLRNNRTCDMTQHMTAQHSMTGAHMLDRELPCELRGRDGPVLCFPLAMWYNPMQLVHLHSWQPHQLGCCCRQLNAVLSICTEPIKGSNEKQGQTDRQTDRQAGRQTARRETGASPLKFCQKLLAPGPPAGRAT